MWNLKTNKEFILIEILISISLFAMLFSFALSLELNELKLGRYNNDFRSSVSFLEGLRGVTVNNLSYNDILYIKNSNKIYVNKANMNYELLKGDIINSIFDEEKPGKYPYISLDIRGEDVLNITMELHSLKDNKEEVLSTRLYKGRYKR